MAAPSRRRVSVCADDFGRNESACRAAIELAATGAISATSVLVDGPAVRGFASGLRELDGHFALGLHLNLTESWGDDGVVCAPRRPFAAWVLAGIARVALPVGAVRQEIRRQIDVFGALFQRLPDFVDGHEHVHQLPGIRELLLEEIAGPAPRIGVVRSTVPRRWRGFKAALIGALGARELERAALNTGLHCNADFAGVYDFSATVSYELRMRTWLATLADRGLVMCHPEADSGAELARVTEYNWLRSNQWLELIDAQHIELAPFSRSRTETR